jgi:hypothetical protein
MGYDQRGMAPLHHFEEDYATDKNQGRSDGIAYRAVRLGDERSIKGTAKEAELRMRRQRYARKRANDARAAAEIEAARYAKLPWPIRAVGAMLDFVFRRSSS